MREIKFRAWDFRNNQMCKVLKMDLESERVYIKMEDKSTVFMDGSKNYINHVTMCKNVVLMQFTGLQDKNGVDIYEGDIVNVCGGIYYCRVWEHDSITVVDNLYCEFLISNFIYGYENIEVIGNIHENPELIQKG